MKAVILSGSPGTALFPLANCYPKIMFPVANEPLIKHMINSLKENDVTDIAIVSSANQKCGKFLANSLNGINGSPRVKYFEEKYSRGTAGSLRQLDGFIADSHFLVISSHLFIEPLHLSEIMAFHRAQNSGITMLVEKVNGGREDLENIEVGENGVVSKVHLLHQSKNNRTQLMPGGIYVFNPRILEHIHDRSYMDIKEQLIPALHSKGIPVYAHTLNESIRKINSHTDYMQLNREILLDSFEHKNGFFSAVTEIRNRVWAGRNVRIAPTAYLLGPLVIGDNCIIEENAHIIGPTSIGNGAHIGRDVMVRESIIWEESRLKSGSRIEYSFISDASVISDCETVINSVVINEKKYQGYIEIASLTNGSGERVISNGNGTMTQSYLRTVRYRIYLAVKRMFDLLISSLFLLIFLPLFIVIPAVIKLDSHGPVLFCQKRCGKDGKEFRMYKFRTMIKDADKEHRMLLSRNDIDGPMFKMTDDPRITRFGRILRKTSFDELPQFFNILKGDMSLVGPRPLVMDEMKYSPNWRDIRLNAKPGITGLWQISERENVSFNAWIQSDIAYVKNRSFWLDISILIKTIYYVIRCIGAR